MVIIIFRLDKLASEVADLRRLLVEGEEFPVDEEEVVETESPIDAMRSEEALERERQFDERIARIKSELANGNSPSNKDYQSVADVLHDDLYNLPHNSIPNETNPPDEYAR